MYSGYKRIPFLNFEEATTRVDNRPTPVERAAQHGHVVARKQLCFSRAQKVATVMGMLATRSSAASLSWRQFDSRDRTQVFHTSYCVCANQGVQRNKAPTWNGREIP
jgi:hypothetical protein